LKNIFQALKLISCLVKKYPENYEDFVFAGVPEKIVNNFDPNWPIEIIKKVIDLFARMAIKNENVKDIIG
jgi:DNA-binding ferritin-like protein (Dps family)